jgi:hypothetical protein
MTKDGTNAADRVAALEQEVETSLRDVCRVLGGDRSGPHLPDEVRRLHKLAQEAAGSAYTNAEMAKLAQKHHDEVQKVADEVAAVRKRAGVAVESFRKKFEKVKGNLDGRSLSAAAIKFRGVLDCGHERLHRFVLHLLVTPGLLAQSRHAAASQHREEEDLRSLRIDAGQNEAGYWPRVDAMLDVVEELGRGFTVEQLQTLKELDVAEDHLEQLVAAYAKTHQGKPWQEWPEVWSVARQKERADEALVQFAQAFVAVRCHEDLDPSRDSMAHGIRRICRRHERAVEQLTIARLEARVEALEMKLAGEKLTRPSKAAPRTKSPSPKTKKGAAK